MSKLHKCLQSSNLDNDQEISYNFKQIQSSSAHLPSRTDAVFIHFLYFWMLLMFKITDFIVLNHVKSKGISLSNILTAISGTHKLRQD